MKNLDAFKSHGDVIWNIANLLRGPYRPPQYRRDMIPFTVLRRLDDVLEASKDAVIKHHKQLKAQTNQDGEPTYLTEYRSALITATTTGKIDVCSWHNPAM